MISNLVLRYSEYEFCLHDLSHLFLIHQIQIWALVAGTILQILFVWTSQLFKNCMIGSQVTAMSNSGSQKILPRVEAPHVVNMTKMRVAITLWVCIARTNNYTYLVGCV